MFIHQMFEEKPFVFSLEIFPPKKKSGNIQSIYQTIEALLNVHPDFISVTFGAGGNLADNSTCEIASTIKNKYGVESVAHLTCVNSSREDVAVMLDRLYQSNVENILALRGDINPDIPPKKDFLYASDLVRVIKQDGRFGISGGCYPECHCEAPDLKTDIAHLKEKVDAGVSHLVSQLFFDNDIMFSFLEKIRAAGITVPVDAGIMPVVNKGQIERMVSMCGASIPPKLAKLLNRYEHDELSLKSAGIDYAIAQIVDLMEHDIQGIHLYSMNNPDVAMKIYNGIEEAIKRRRG